MTYVPKATREAVTRRASGRCEYCQTPQAIVVEMVIDQIVPEIAGGETTPDNLCLACISCNLYKRDFQLGIDPETNSEVILFNPAPRDGRTTFSGVKMEYACKGRRLPVGQPSNACV